MMVPDAADCPSSIAIIGMAGRFPGAHSVAEFWQNQLNGVEAIRRFSPQDLDRSFSKRGSETGFVAARSVLDDVDLFDAEFFGMYPKEAELTDPQHRLFLEICWEAFEDAGYDPGSLALSVGAFAGCSMPTYFLSRLCSQGGFVSRFTGGYQVENYAEMIGNSLDFLATRVSYKLNLRGPSFTLQAGCSTSLVAVCQACQSLLTQQCDMAIAGGVSVTFPQNRGARYQEGGMISPDGHCRTFDANANGTVFGSGVGALVLKRLEDAQRDRDQIYTVIRGFALNNDGSAKAGFTAPSIDGQARVIELAHRVAGVRPESIGYVEAHGTATPLGDPIELTALSRAFRKSTPKKKFCVIGTAKTNVGHLDIASGVTGLIHAAHIVRHAIFPATLHFQQANPKFDLEESPFRVQKQTAIWQESPRRAGVSAFGVGGTNAHVVIEQAPELARAPDMRKAQLLVLSARSASALAKAQENLAAHLETHPELSLCDVAFTLQAGRKQFAYRHYAVADTAAEAAAALRASGVRSKPATAEAPGVCFLFPGQGAQKPGMVADLYARETLFRDLVDYGSDTLQPILGEDLRRYLCFVPDSTDDLRVLEEQIRQTRIAQPALFVAEYALASLLQSWGIRPAAMLGHSVGEYAAAVVAGVMDLKDALLVVARRGAMMQALPPGAMLAVRLPQEQLAEYLGPSLSLAAENAPSQCVVSGPEPDIARLEERLRQRKVLARRLRTSHAFHSAMMDPMLEDFRRELRNVPLGPPQIPYISDLTGDWADERLIGDPQYWSQHARGTVQFSRGLRQVQKNGCVFLELGPGQALTSLAHENSLHSSNFGALACASENGALTRSALLEALGRLWTLGVRPDWDALHKEESPVRVSLPTYPFERKRFWFEPNALAADSSQPETQEASEVIEATPARPIPQQTPRDRVANIALSLQELLTELSGTALSPEQHSATFLELGFDSLFLTQVVLALKSKFRVSLTFRELLAEHSSIAALARHLDSVLPADQFAPEASAVPAVSPHEVQAAAPARSLDSPAVARELPPSYSLEHLVQQQLQAMNQLFAQQLQAIRTHLPPSAAGTTAASAAPSATQAISAVPEVPAPMQKPDPGRAENKPFGPYKPPQTTRSTTLDERQKQFVSELIARYTRRTLRSKELTQERRAQLADPRVVSGFRPEWKEIVYPIVTTSSKRSRLWDVDGNEYIDILNGFGPIFLGHRPDFVERAVEEQLHLGFEIGPQTPLAGEVAQLFCELTGNERMTFCNTGSEAVLAALRVARTVTGRSKVVLFSGAYHGMFDEVLVKGVPPPGRPQALPIAPGIPKESVLNMVVLEYGAAHSLEWIREHAAELAAVLVEPVQSRHPALQPRDFLHGLRSITAQSGAALIFDEVVTGFRVHPGGCQALFDIRADLATYGKVLAGGMPIGVLAGRSEFMNALDGGMWSFGDESYPSAGVTFFAGTFVRHPLALAAARSVLRHLKETGPSLQSDLNQRSAGFAAQLNALFTEYAVPARVEQFSSIFYFHFPAEFWLGSLLFYQLRLRGIYILEGFPFFLTSAHTEGDLIAILDAFRDSFRELRYAGILAPVNEEINAPAATIEKLPEPETGTARLDSEPVLVPMTEEQLEIALAAQISAQASCAYNESFTLRFQGKLDEQALLDALEQIVQRHDSLRISLLPESRTCAIQARAELAVEKHDFSALSAAEADSRFSELLRMEGNTPFDFARAPLARAHLIRYSEENHALVFTAHHIVCDGWSTNVLLSELASLYSARVAGTPNLLPPPPMFRDYARAQSVPQGNPPREQQTADAQFWRGQFTRVPPPLELPTDRARSATRSFAGATRRTTIANEFLREVRAAGARQGCTLFSTLLAGFAALLHRLTSQDDIVIGIPAAGQSALPDGQLVGHCVNFLPLRFSFPQACVAADFLKDVRRTVLEAYEHQNYTYGTLVRDLQIPREPGRLPLLEVQFNLEKVGTGLDFRALQVTVDPNPKCAVNFDLFLNVVEGPDGLTLDCDYNSDLFDDATIRRWLGHFATLLKAMAERPGTELDRLPILTPSEQQQIVCDWNRTDRHYPRNSRVHEIVQQQTSKTPDATALVCGEDHRSYSELERRSNQLARHLVKIGVRPGQLVAICVERSPEMLTALLAVWKAGAAYLPLDAGHPAERLGLILEDARVPFLITESGVLQELPASEARMICLDRDAILVERESEEPVHTPGSSENLAYVIYTSGSTGKPKGVGVTHQNVVNLLCATLQELGMSPGDRFLAVTTLSFDIAVLELFLPLVAGACVVLAKRDEAFDGNRLRALIQRHSVTLMQGTPATWKLLIEAGWSEPLRILCGGEALSRDLADRLLIRGEVWNMYGPTETTIWSSASRVFADGEPVPIGPPLANTQFYVLDSLLQPVPVGVRGELFIGGDGVSQGYYGRPDLTEKAFLADPFRSSVRNRIYRTGDLVRQRADGRIIFLGRSDHQVKIRGFRVELQEIEAVLGRQQGIREAVVLDCDDDHGLKRLVAYVSTQADSEATPRLLRRTLGLLLPSYMVPSSFVFVDRLPRTPNGKIDRLALPSWREQRPQEPVTAPMSELQSRLARICAEVLGLPAVDREVSLFDLGADSLHLFQIVARAVSQGIPLQIDHILRFQRISDVAEALEKQRNRDSSSQPGQPELKALSREAFRVASLVR